MVRVAGYVLRGTCYGVRVAWYVLRGTCYVVRVAGCAVRGTCCGVGKICKLGVKFLAGLILSC